MVGSQDAFAGSIQAVSRRLEIRPQALADITEAAARDEERQPGLGERFTREVVAVIHAARHDLRWQERL